MSRFEVGIFQNGRSHVDDRLPLIANAGSAGRVRAPARQQSYALSLVLVILLTGACAISCSQDGGNRAGFLNPSSQQEGTPNTNSAKVWFLLDRSGSMDPVRSDVVVGFNGFVSELRGQPGDCQMTLVLFDEFQPFDVVFSAMPIINIPDLKRSDYRPDGGTPFYDALGTLIVRADTRIANRIAQGEPAEDQLVVILTDGLENASFRYNQRKIGNLIQDRQDEGWTFVFLGANQDSYAEGARIGLTGGNIQNFKTSGQSIALAYDSVSRATKEYCGKSSGQRKDSISNFFGGFKEAEGGN